MSEAQPPPEKQYPDEAVYNKLVRNKVIDIIRASGLEAEYRIINGPEKVNGIIDKIVEESQELLEAESEGDRVKEFSDVLQFIYDFVDETGIELPVVEKDETTTIQDFGFHASRVLGDALKLKAASEVERSNCIADILKSTENAIEGVGMDRTEIERIRAKREEERGGSSEGIYLQRTYRKR